MKPLRKVLCCSVVASVLALCSCDNNATFTKSYAAVTISPLTPGVAQGTTQVFTGTDTNGGSAPQWSLLAANTTTNTPNAGTLTAITGQPNSILYIAPPAPPLYSSAAPAGIQPGSVTLTATIAAQGSVPVSNDTISFEITAPNTTVTLTPAAVNVPLGSSFQFTGYELGNANYGLTWQVNGTAGGVPAYNSNGTPNTLSSGTITTLGLYTAPPVMPTTMTGSTVTITMISQGDPTKTATATITLQ